MIDFIRGERFIGIADYTFAPLNSRDDDYTHLRNTLDVSKIKDGDIIYTHTFYVHDLFEIIRRLDKRVKVVTHNCDMNVDFAPPDNVIMWFTQNVNIVHPRVQSIPIGLQNHHWNKYGNKEAIMLEQLKQPRKYRNLLYVNHNVNTNPDKRSGIYELFQDKPWATCERRVKNFERFREYIKDIYEHQYVLCPEGNGVDTHRLWETLYMGSTPIVSDNINNKFYVDLCPITLPDWSFVTEELLTYRLNYLYWASNIEMLTFKYWADKIRNT